MELLKKVFWQLAWFLWWLIRYTPLLGIYVAAFRESKDGSTQILIIYKLRGLFTGWCLPGGGQDKNKSNEEQAAIELFQEGGLKSAKRFIVVDVFHDQKHKDEHILFVTKVNSNEQPEPKDTFEISKAEFVDIKNVAKYLSGEQLRKATNAILWYTTFYKKELAQDFDNQ